MSDHKQYKMWQCPACDMLWQLTPEEEETFVCFCGVSQVIMPILREAARKFPAPKRKPAQKPPAPKPKDSSHKLAKCAFCDTWWRIPKAAPSPDCDCPQTKGRRARSRASRPGPFNRFIEDDLEFD